MSRRHACLAIAAALLATTAEARVYDTYRPDSPKGAFCSAIAGACSADPTLESGFYQNPASIGAAPAGWNFDIDYNGSANSEPGAKTENSINEGNFSGAIGKNYGDWGMAFTLVGRRSQTESSVSVTDSQGLTQKFPLTATSTSLDLRVPLAYRATPNLSLGFTLSTLLWSQSLEGHDGSRADIARKSSPIRWQARLGALYHIPESNFSFGSWFKLPSTRYSHIQFDTQAYGNSLHYEEDVALHDPWTWAFGTRWCPWSDERAFLFDLKAIGATSGGYQLTYDTFATALGEKALRTKGRNVIFEPRLGYQWPTQWTENRKSSILLGSFYESARTEETSGRIHFTGGVSYEVLSNFELMIGGDFAKNFAQLFISFR